MDQGFIPNTSFFVLVQLTTHVPRSPRRCCPLLTIDVENASSHIVCSQQAPDVNVGELLHCHRAGAESARAQPILRPSSASGMREVPTPPLWRTTGAPAPAARQRRRVIYNEDPRSHLTTATGERCPCAMYVACNGCLAVPQAAELRCLALLQRCMIEERWLWRLLSCRMQDIGPPMFRRCGCAGEAASRAHADQPHPLLRYPRPCLPLRDRQTVAAQPRQTFSPTAHRQAPCGVWSERASRQAHRKGKGTNRQNAETRGHDCSGSVARGHRPGRQHKARGQAQRCMSAA